MAGHDLGTPESLQFYVSGAVRPGGDPDKARQAIAVHVDRLRQTPAPAINFAMVRLQLLGELEPPDPAALAAAPLGRVPAELVEAQAAVSWATTAYASGRRGTLTRKRFQNSVPSRCARRRPSGWPMTG